MILGARRDTAVQPSVRATSPTQQSLTPSFSFLIHTLPPLISSFIPPLSPLSRDHFGHYLRAPSRRPCSAVQNNHRDHRDRSSVLCDFCAAVFLEVVHREREYDRYR